MSGPQGPFVPAQPAPHSIDPHVRIGNVHLPPSDVDRFRWRAYDNPEFIDASMDVDALLAQL